MAELVLGIGTSHSPQLSVSWEGWAMRGEADKGNPALIGTDGIVSGYDELLARALELAIPGAYGPRVAESGIGLITNMSSSAPYEELRLKGQ